MEEKEMTAQQNRQEMLNRMNLFEALVMGIYGNWLISSVDKISFLKAPTGFNIFSWGYQPVGVGLSFGTLLLLFAYCIFYPNAVTRPFGIILGVGHIVGNWGALFVEGFTVPLFVFFCIGMVLFLVIYAIEIKRVRISRINRQTE